MSTETVTSTLPQSDVPPPIPICLRDWFAGQALTGLISHHLSYGPNELFAKKAYELADAMITAREAKS